MAKLQSTFTNMVLSLTLIALVAAGALGGVYLLTEEPIAQQKEQKQQNAIGNVLPQADNMTLAEPEQSNGYIIYRAYADDIFIGAAVETETDGFGGKIKLMVGFDAEGNIVNYEVLEQTETPGLGTHIVEWFKTDKNNQSVLGLNPANANLTVKKDGGDVDAITAATISSRAFLLAVRNAYSAYAGADPTEAQSGASIISTTEPETACTDSIATYTQDNTINANTQDNNE